MNTQLHKLYTIGYAQLRSVTQLINLAHPKGAVIADIRFTPWSKDEQWRHANLLKRLCDLDFGGFNCSYTHIKDLGNVNYKNGGPIQVYQPEAGLTQLKGLLVNRPVILLCACYNLETCHRKVVAGLAAHHLGCVVEHLNLAENKPPPAQAHSSMF